MTSDSAMDEPFEDDDHADLYAKNGPVPQITGTFTPAARVPASQALLFLRFSAGTVTYREDFRVFIEGSLWPRELEAADRVIEIYKQQSKLGGLA